MEGPQTGRTPAGCHQAKASAGPRAPPARDPPSRAPGSCWLSPRACRAQGSLRQHPWSRHKGLADAPALWPTVSGVPHPARQQPGLFPFPELSFPSVEKHLCPSCRETQRCFPWSCVSGEDSVHRRTGEEEHGAAQQGGRTGPPSAEPLSAPASLASWTPWPRQAQRELLAAAPPPAARPRPSAHAPPRWGSGSSTCPAHAARTPRGRCP